MKRSLLYGLSFALAIIFGFGVPGCKKGKKGDKKEWSAKSKQLMHKTWKYDAEAVRTFALTKAGKKSGITNLKGIKLKKDVKKFADFLSSKRLFFGVQKKGSKGVYKVTTGKGLLSSSYTGWWEWQDNETKLKLIGAGKRKGKDVVYLVKELTDKKLVLLRVGSKTGTPEIYKR